MAYHDHSSHARPAHAYSHQGHAYRASETCVGIAALLTGVFMLAEAAGGNAELLMGIE